MPIKHINHAIKEGNRHGPLFVPLLIIVFIFSIAFFCASINYFIRLFCMNRRRSRSDIARQRYLPVGLRDKKSKKRKNNSDDSSNSSTDDDDDWEEQYHVWDPEEARLVKQQRNSEEKVTELNNKGDIITEQKIIHVNNRDPLLDLNQSSIRALTFPFKKELDRRFRYNISKIVFQNDSREFIWTKNDGLIRIN